MAEKTLTDLGANCTQSSTTITLSKADLGLTAETCTLDQIILAIAVKAKAILTQANFDSEPNQNLYLSDGFNSFTTKNNESWILRQITINFAKQDTEATIDPNDY
ncbi:hypothetical protein [Sphaerospermopsis sp. LEGE 08334]|uniref:hypothetical protein n=1 Tax=Sphaerospermopsis sp. LEGE 08334 TaxID=1828651 RepID=UPI00187DF41D|nr:hypothetical protein [Sphaerospermopsis sp. LEGE 08334]MBE9056352.1 hypothetical protein [Sphaerospermopsis sp. LEGE 08334]